MKTPYTEDYNLSVEYSVKQSMAATVSYVGAQSHHLIVFTNPNAPLALQNSNAEWAAVSGWEKKRVL